VLHSAWIFDKKHLIILETKQKQKIVKLCLQTWSFSLSFLFDYLSTEPDRCISLGMEKSCILFILAVVTELCTPYFDLFWVHFLREINKQLNQSYQKQKDYGLPVLITFFPLLTYRSLGLLAIELSGHLTGKMYWLITISMPSFFTWEHLKHPEMCNFFVCPIYVVAFYFIQDTWGKILTYHCKV
jgi:hypothetical protein